MTNGAVGATGAAGAAAAIANALKAMGAIVCVEPQEFLAIFGKNRKTACCSFTQWIFDQIQVSDKL